MECKGAIIPTWLHREIQAEPGAAVQAVALEQDPHQAQVALVVVAAGAAEVLAAAVDAAAVVAADGTSINQLKINFL